MTRTTRTRAKRITDKRLGEIAARQRPHRVPGLGLVRTTFRVPGGSVYVDDLRLTRRPDGLVSWAGTMTPATGRPSTGPDAESAVTRILDSLLRRCASTP